MGGKTPSTAAAQQLGHLSTKAFFESDPARRELFKQMTEALKTGGVGARIPIIQRGEANLAQGGAMAAKNARELSGRMGLAGTPFGLRAETGATAPITAAQASLPTDIAMQLIGAAPPAVTSGTGIPGLASAASIQTGASGVGLANQAATAGGIGSGLGSILGSYLSSGGRFGLGGTTQSTAPVAPTGVQQSTGM